MDHAPLDLPALARDLPDEVLDWRPDAASLTLRRVLRHTGQADPAAQARRLLLAWWQAEGAGRRTGSAAVLRAALAAARGELLAAAGRVPPEERASRPVCGHWTLKDVVGHLSDWEWVGAQGLGHMAAGRAPQVEHIKDIDAWNEAHCRARRDQTWAEVWDDLGAAREALVDALGPMDQALLARAFAFPWGPSGTAYQWVGVYVAHDLEHAAGLRGA